MTEVAEVLLAMAGAYTVAVTVFAIKAHKQVRKTKKVLFTWYAGFDEQISKQLPQDTREDLADLKTGNVLASILVQTGLAGEFADWIFRKRVGKP